MPKPWGKLQIGWIKHSKFLALSGNAICFWLEIKDYSDEHLTDGIVPMLSVKRMRFYSQANLDALLRSAGPKPSGDLRTPLVAPLDIGGVAHLKMRKYLDHNDCRDKVVARMEAAENERQKDRDRKQAWRESRKSGSRPADVPPDVRSDVRHVSGPVSTLASDKSPALDRIQLTETEEVLKNTHTPRARDRFGPTLMGNEHRAHAACGRICVPAFLHRQFKDALGGDERTADETLRNWYSRVFDQLPEDERVPTDAGKFWRPLFDAEFVTTKPAVDVNLQAHAEGIREILRKQGAL